MNLNPLKAGEQVKPEEFKFKRYMDQQHKNREMEFYDFMKYAHFYDGEMDLRDAAIYKYMEVKFFTKEELEYVNSLPDDENLIDEDGFLNEL